MSLGYFFKGDVLVIIKAPHCVVCPVLSSAELRLLKLSAETDTIL